MSVRIILTHAASPPARPADPEAIYCSLGSGWMWRGGVSVLATHAGRRLFLALAASAPAVLTRQEAIDALWGGRPDGGPENAERLVYQAAAQARTIAAALGLVVETDVTHGWSARPVKRATDEGAAP